MNIKDKIGQRIKEERVAKGLTLKALEELTDDLKQTRISNWERGYRTPGPEEIKQLAQALAVSPAYLMCLTDEKQPKKKPGLNALIPLLNFQQACEAKLYIQRLKNNQNEQEVSYIPVTAEFSAKLEEYSFALKMIDESMHPELRLNDLLIINPSAKLHPGNLVAVQLEEEQVIIRRYKQLTFSKNNNSFELKAENDHWGNIIIDKMSDCTIIGIVVGIIRYFSE